MGGSKWVTLWKVQPDGTRVKVGKITRAQQKKILEAQERTKQLSQMKNLHKMRENQSSVENRRKIVAETISKTTNKKELQDAMESLGLGDKASFIKEIKNFDSAKDIASAIADMSEVFGTEYFSDATTQGQFGKGTRGYIFPGEYTIHLNKKEFDERDVMMQECKLESDIGYAYKNQSPASIVKHEYAHLLQNKLCDDLMNTDQFKNVRRQQESAQRGIDALTENYPKEWKKATTFLEKAMNARNIFDQIKYTNKAMEAMQNVMKPVEHRVLFSNIRTVLQSRQVIGKMISTEATRKIGGIFNNIGYKSPTDVAKGLTGSNLAYARTNWSEAHAECVADYMTNGQNASPVSIAYVEAFAKAVGVKLK